MRDAAVSQGAGNNEEVKQLLAAYEESAALGAWILTACIEENQEYFGSSPALLAKVKERMVKGHELAESGNFRTANIIQRHAIDLILQEDHKVFKNSADLRQALLRYRDLDLNIIVPLYAKHSSDIK